MIKKKKKSKTFWKSNGDPESSSGWHDVSKKKNEILNQVQDDIMCWKSKWDPESSSGWHDVSKKRMIQDDIQKYLEKIGVIYEIKN